jgi:hypothetical protein
MAEFTACHKQREGTTEEIDDLGCDRTENQQRIQLDINQPDEHPSTGNRSDEPELEYAGAGDTRRRLILAIGNYKTFTINAIVC